MASATAQRQTEKAAAAKRATKARQAEARAGDLKNAAAYIEKHYPDGIKLTQIAAEAGFSPFHFHRLFTTYYSETPKQFILRLQIADAKDRILRGEKLSEIARACGFAHQSHFNTRFMQHAKTTPLKWRTWRLSVEAEGRRFI